MKTNWIFITVAFTALLSVTPAAVQAKNWTNEPLMTVQEAAEQGDADAQSNLGIMYRQGLGVPQDYSQALRWYKKAAEQGQVNAQYNLGLMYSKGLGVPKDYSKAYAFFSALVAYGDKSSIERRDDMAKKLTPAELSKAQKLAAEYFEKYQPK